MMAHLPPWLAAIPDDPVLLVGAVLAVWLPLCAVALGALALLATVQSTLRARPRVPARIVLPPAELRPLAVRHEISRAPHRADAVTIVRLLVAIAAVLAVTALVLASSGSSLLHALHT